MLIDKVITVLLMCFVREWLTFHNHLPNISKCVHLVLKQSYAQLMMNMVLVYTRLTLQAIAVDSRLLLVE